MPNDILSAQWITVVNGLLSDHDTGTVQEFRLTVEIKVDEWEDHDFVGLELSDSRLRFITELDGSADATVHLAESALVDAIISGPGTAIRFNELSAAGQMRPSGDYAKLAALQDGVIRHAPQGLLDDLLAATTQA